MMGIDSADSAGRWIMIVNEEVQATSDMGVFRPPVKMWRRRPPAAREKGIFSVAVELEGKRDIHEFRHGTLLRDALIELGLRDLVRNGEVRISEVPYLGQQPDSCVPFWNCQTPRRDSVYRVRDWPEADRKRLESGTFKVVVDIEGHPVETHIFAAPVWFPHALDHIGPARTREESRLKLNRVHWDGSEYECGMQFKAVSGDVLCLQNRMRAEERRAWPKLAWSDPRDRKAEFGISFVDGRTGRHARTATEAHSLADALRTCRVDGMNLEIRVPESDSDSRTLPLWVPINDLNALPLGTGRNSVVSVRLWKDSSLRDMEKFSRMMENWGAGRGIAPGTVHPDRIGDDPASTDGRIGGDFIEEFEKRIHREPADGRLGEDFIEQFREERHREAADGGFAGIAQPDMRELTLRGLLDMIQRAHGEQIRSAAQCASDPEGDAVLQALIVKMHGTIFDDAFAELERRLLKYMRSGI